MFNLGFGEVLILCAVVAIVVGPGRLSQLPAMLKAVEKKVSRSLLPLGFGELLILCLVVLTLMAMLIASKS